MNGTSLLEFTKESFSLIDLRAKNFDDIRKIWVILKKLFHLKKNCKF